MDNNLVVISSALQAICAVTGTEYFKFDSNTAFEFVNSSEKMRRRNVGVEYYLEKKGIKYKRIIIKNQIEALCFFFRKRTKYDKIIIGDYYSGFTRLYALSKLKKNGLIIYVDDGNSSLSILKDKRSFNIKSIFFKYLIEFITKIKKEREILFTIFSDNCCVHGIDVIKNNLFEMTNHNSNRSNRIIVIGSYEEEFMRNNQDYFDFLSRVESYILKEYDNFDVEYYPHRMEYNKKKLMDYCTNKRWKYRISKVCIEEELLDAHEMPLAIIGFGSSALMTLRTIFPHIPIVSFHYLNTPEMINIEKEYNSYGIEIRY